MGSWLTYGLGTENQNLPGFVVLLQGGVRSGPGVYGQGFLPAAYQGTTFRAGRNPILNLTPPAGMKQPEQRDLLDTLRALNERRVETLVMDERFSADGTCCPTCGWLGPAGERTCPADGTPLEQLVGDDLVEAAVELTIQQSAEILAVRRRRDELADRADGVAALLRF
jgi:hypothetical protein